MYEKKLEVFSCRTNFHFPLWIPRAVGPSQQWRADPSVVSPENRGVMKVNYVGWLTNHRLGNWVSFRYLSWRENHSQISRMSAVAKEFRKKSCPWKLIDVFSKKENWLRNQTIDLAKIDYVKISTKFEGGEGCVCCSLLIGNVQLQKFIKMEFIQSKLSVKWLSLQKLIRFVNIFKCDSISRLGIREWVSEQANFPSVTIVRCYRMYLTFSLDLII